jgi:hypothetical protein
MMKKLTYATLLIAAIAALAGAPAAGAATDVRLDLTPGELVRIDGVGAVVPPPGQFVYAESLGENGASEMTVVTKLDGTVLVDDHVGDAMSDDVGGELSPVTAPDACSDGAYNFNKFKRDSGATKKFRWNSTFNWRFNEDSTPSEITKSNALTDIQQGTRNITWVNTNCSGFGDNVSASANYAGTTQQGSNIDQKTNCGSADGTSATVFGTIDPTDKLGVACVWGDWNEGGEWAIAHESDTKFDKDNHNWYTGPSCPAGVTNWSLEAVATHERGHTFSLDHVGEAEHGNLTMSPKMEGKCKKPEATLGKGDILGLEAAY